MDDWMSGIPWNIVDRPGPAQRRAEDAVDVHPVRKRRRPAPPVAPDLERAGGVRPREDRGHPVLCA